MSIFRHVVMFRWDDRSTIVQRERAIAGLKAFAEEVRDLGTLSIGVDAGVADGNFDALVIADFDDRDAYLAYADDPRHKAMITEHLAPIVAGRAALQTQLD